MKYIKLFESFANENYNYVNEDFNTQKIKFINQGYDEKIVNRYINDFKDLRNKKFKEAKNANIEGLKVPAGESRFNIDNYQTFKELELIIDYVAGQRNFGSSNFEDINVDADPVFKDLDVEIYYADSPKACIQYKGNKPYGWCIARNTGNMFYNYRLSELEPSFYFVKRIKSTEKEFSFWNMGKSIFNGEFRDKWHFFVLQILNIRGKKKYIITSAMNDGDKQVSWDEVLKIAPELEGKESIFKKKPLTPVEKEKIEKYKDGISDDVFIKLSFKEKKYFMSIYVNMENRLSEVQFNNLPEELKNDYINYGVGLSDFQFDLIKSESNLLKRYIDITNKKYEAYKKQDESDDISFLKSELKIIYKNFIENKTYENYELKKLLSDKNFFEEFNELEILTCFAIVEKTRESAKYPSLDTNFKITKIIIEELLRKKDLESMKIVFNFVSRAHEKRIENLSEKDKEYYEYIKKETLDRMINYIYHAKPKELDYNLINNLILSSDNKEMVIRKLLTPEIVKEIGWNSFIISSKNSKAVSITNSLTIDLIVSNKEIVDLLKPNDLIAIRMDTLYPREAFEKIKEIRPELIVEYNRMMEISGKKNYGSTYKWESFP